MTEIQENSALAKALHAHVRGLLNSNPDMRRETDQAVVGLLQEDYMGDRALLADVRERFGRSRTQREAYGERISDASTVTLVMFHLAMALHDRHTTPRG